jgi:hypothetical protein
MQCAMTRAVTKRRFAFSVLRERKPPAIPDLHVNVLTKSHTYPFGGDRQLPSSVATLSNHFLTLLISTLKTEQYGSSKQRYLHTRLHKTAPKCLCSFCHIWPCTPLAASTYDTFDSQQGHPCMSVRLAALHVCAVSKVKHAPAAEVISDGRPSLFCLLGLSVPLWRASPVNKRPALLPRLLVLLEQLTVAQLVRRTSCS